MNAGIAAFRAGAPPAILQVLRGWHRDDDAAKGASSPCSSSWRAGGEVRPKAYIPTITATTPRPRAKCCPCLQLFHAVFYYSKDALRKAGLDAEKPQSLASCSTPRVRSRLPDTSTADHHWISWIQLENFSAWHNLPTAPRPTASTAWTPSSLQRAVQVRHFENLYKLSKEKVFVYGGARTRPTRCSPRPGSDPLRVHRRLGNMKATASSTSAWLASLLSECRALRRTRSSWGSLWVMGKKTWRSTRPWLSSSPSSPAPRSRPSAPEHGLLPITRRPTTDKSQGFYKENPARRWHPAAAEQARRPTRWASASASCPDPRDPRRGVGKHPGRQEDREAGPGRHGAAGQRKLREFERANK